jgi:XTP/dITP diphosphohydrolase
MMNTHIEYWDVVELVWDEINIYESADVFLSTYSSVEPPAGQLYAAHFAQSEICNGGFRQLFWNSTGVLSPEAAQGFELIRMPQTANLVISAMEIVGSPFPRDRDERQKALERVSKDRLDQLDKQFFKDIETENGGFEAAANAFVNKQRESILDSFPSLATRVTLYVATSNQGKLRDFARASTPHVAIKPLPNLSTIPAPPEDEPTFEGNARFKAIFYSHHAPNEIVIADDSGLEVDALHGAPGVRSARYAEDHNFHEPANANTDERNNLYLISNLTDIPLTQRSARYHCVLAAARNGQILAIGHGAVEGEILTTPRGTDGFGYDPLFYLPAQKKTMAELDIATKLTFSHRGRAFAALISELNSGLHSHSSR